MNLDEFQSEIEELNQEYFQTIVEYESLFTDSNRLTSSSINKISENRKAILEKVRQKLVKYFPTSLHELHSYEVGEIRTESAKIKFSAVFDYGKNYLLSALPRTITRQSRIFIENRDIFNAFINPYYDATRVHMMYFEPPDLEFDIKSAYSYKLGGEHVSYATGPSIRSMLVHMRFRVFPLSFFGYSFEKIAEDMCDVKVDQLPFNILCKGWLSHALFNVNKDLYGNHYKLNPFTMQLTSHEGGFHLEQMIYYDRKKHETISFGEYGFDSNIYFEQYVRSKDIKKTAISFKFPSGAVESVNRIYIATNEVISENRVTTLFFRIRNEIERLWTRENRGRYEKLLCFIIKYSYINNEGIKIYLFLVSALIFLPGDKIEYVKPKEIEYWQKIIQ